jgi:hypothetical protein
MLCFVLISTYHISGIQLASFSLCSWFLCSLVKVLCSFKIVFGTWWFFSSRFNNSSGNSYFPREYNDEINLVLLFQMSICTWVTVCYILINKILFVQLICICKVLFIASNVDLLKCLSKFYGGLTKSWLSTYILCFVLIS